VRAQDQGFVAARPAVVYRALCDFASYGLWWPGIGVDTGSEGFRLRLVAGAAASARADVHREDVGLVIRLGPPYRGTLEWYLEGFEEGTIVNSVMHLDLPGGPRRADRLARRLRSAVRRGLVGLKRELEGSPAEVGS
jgi:Polyketide cyclase / dehydrase and lipid transport